MEIQPVLWQCSKFTGSIFCTVTLGVASPVMLVCDVPQRHKIKSNNKKIICASLMFRIMIVHVKEAHDITRMVMLVPTKFCYFTAFLNAVGATGCSKGPQHDSSTPMLNNWHVVSQGPLTLSLQPSLQLKKQLSPSSLNGSFPKTEKKSCFFSRKKRS